MARMIELTDLMEDGIEPETAVPVDQVAATLRTWYPADECVRPSELDDLEALQAALVAEDYPTARDLGAELSIRFNVVV